MVRRPKHHEDEMALYRAEKSRFNDSWSIEREYACINGLSCWFQVAVVNEADEAEMGYTDGEFGSAQERAEKITKALNAAVAPAAAPCPTTAHFHPGKTYLTQGGQAMRIERWSGADGRYATEQSRRPVWYREDGKCDVREWSHYDLLPGAIPDAVGSDSVSTERERCAAIAQRWSQDASKIGGERLEIQANVCRNLAQAIRNSGNGK